MSNSSDVEKSQSSQSDDDQDCDDECDSVSQNES